MTQFLRLGSSKSIDVAGHPLAGVTTIPRMILPHLSQTSHQHSSHQFSSRPNNDLHSTIHRTHSPSSTCARDVSLGRPEAPRATHLLHPTLFRLPPSTPVLHPPLIMPQPPSPLPIPRQPTPSLIAVLAARPNHSHAQLPALAAASRKISHLPNSSTTRYCIILLARILLHQVQDQLTSSLVCSL